MTLNKSDSFQKRNLKALEDHIINDELLVSRDGWRNAGFAEAETVTIENETGVYFPENGIVRIPFPATSHPLNEYNQLVLDVYAVIPIRINSLNKQGTIS